MNSTLTVVQVSESAFSVQGHGVHTAFIETVRGLTKAGVTVCTNRLWGKADIRHIHTTGPYSLLHLLFGSGKKIVSAHVVPASFVGSLKGAKYWLGCATWYLRWFYNRADVVIAVSDATKTELRRIGVSRPIEVIHNMVDTRRYH
jgi:1,2-diacylglycerol-3-alpha-glucose alpha-1,2-galactosyltransferase